MDQEIVRCRRGYRRRVNSKIDFPAPALKMDGWQAISPCFRSVPEIRWTEHVGLAGREDSKDIADRDETVVTGRSGSRNSAARDSVQNSVGRPGRRHPAVAVELSRPRMARNLT